MLLFNFIFLPPSRNLCNVPAAPQEAGAAVSHRCCWNVTQSCCCSPPGHDRTAKTWEKPNAAAARPRPPAGRTREPPHIAQHPAGASPHCRGAELSVGELSMGGRLFFFYYYYYSLIIFFPLFYLFLSFFFPPSQENLLRPLCFTHLWGRGCLPKDFAAPSSRPDPVGERGTPWVAPAPGIAPAPVPVPQFPHPKGNGDVPRQGAGGVTSGRALRSRGAAAGCCD